MTKYNIVESEGIVFIEHDGSTVLTIEELATDPYSHRKYCELFVDGEPSGKGAFFIGHSPHPEDMSDPISYINNILTELELPYVAVVTKVVIENDLYEQGQTDQQKTVERFLEIGYKKKDYTHLHHPLSQLLHLPAGISFKDIKLKHQYKRLGLVIADNGKMRFHVNNKDEKDLNKVVFHTHQSFLDPVIDILKHTRKDHVTKSKFMIYMVAAICKHLSQSDIYLDEDGNLLPIIAINPWLTEIHVRLFKHDIVINIIPDKGTVAVVFDDEAYCFGSPMELTYVLLDNVVGKKTGDVSFDNAFLSILSKLSVQLQNILTNFK